MRRTVLLGITLLAVPSIPARPAPAAIDLCHFRQTITDDFTSLSVSPWGGNSSRWIAHTPWNGDFGNAEFTDPKPGFPFSIVDGHLRIEARKGPDDKWRSGLLASADPQAHGFAQR